MGRILAIDFGKKKTGIAVTDPLQIIASALDTIDTKELLSFLKNYITSEKVDIIVLGEPLHPDGNPAQIAPEVYTFAKKLEKLFPDIPVKLQDERNTSKKAFEILIKSGAGRKKRRNKKLVDKISAALILEDYMNENVW